MAGDANTAGEMYPDQSLYPVDSVPRMVERINNALLRTDQIHHMEGKTDIDWLAPIIADAEAGFGGNLNAFELTKALIRAGAAAVHFEDQLSSAKKCGHLGGKVLVSTAEAINKLVAARLAADVLDVPTVVIARTDADAANLLLTDNDSRDRPFLTGERSSEGFFHVRCGIDQAIARGLAYAPYADLIWCETSKPDLAEARRFAAAIHERYPQKLLAYNCSPSFNWQGKLNQASMKSWREDLAAMGYRFQFITLAGWHALNLSMFELASAYRRGRHARLFADAAARIQPGAGRVPRHQTPGVRRHRILRRGSDRHHRRSALDRRDGRQHRDRAIRLGRTASRAEACGRLRISRRRSPSISAHTTRNSAASPAARR